MPIDSKHPEYENTYSLQEKTRIVCQGEDAVKASREQFLPMLGGQDANKYNAYLQRASFFNASGRTLAGLTGVVFRKPPKVEFPNEDFLDSVTIDGDDHMVFLRRCVKEVIQVGRLGLLADTRDSNELPYVSVYQAESIINWRTEIVDGKKKTTLVVLEEKRYDYSDDPFKPEEKTVYRVLVLTDNTREELEALGDNKGFFLQPSADQSNAFYAVAVYEKEEKVQTQGKPQFTLIDGPFFPEIRGARMREIPFVVANVTDLSIDNLENPPIVDVVNINISHYRSSADLKHGLHFTALPTAWVAGFKSDQQLMIGSETAWVAEDPSAKAGFLEFAGSGLGAIKEDMKDMQEQMAVLGSRLLEEPKRQVEAAETHQSRKSGESSVIAVIASNVESAVKKAFQWCAEWTLNNPDDVEVSLNKDYVSALMDSSMLTALLMTLQQGRISYDSFIYNLSQGELLPDGRTAEEEAELIQQNPPLPQPNVTEDLGEDEDEDIEDEDEEDEEQEEAA